MTHPSEPLRLVWLYARDMNVYGDWGNVLTIIRRLEWHGYTSELVEYNPGDSFPEKVDLIIGGGGQDSGQEKIQTDLLRLGPQLTKLAEDGLPILVICGLYQLFGNFFQTHDGQVIRGIGLFDMETKAGPERLTGNVVTSSDQFGTIIGCENHSGQTYLGLNTAPLAKVIKGAGNNGQDATEGAQYKNVIGSYLHGSLLPKNPALADWLIEQAIVNKFGDFQPTVIDDRFADLARQIALKRPR